MNEEYLTFSELCEETGLSKYHLRYFQAAGYFEPIQRDLAKQLPDWAVYDIRWVEVWSEARAYMAFGLDELRALSEAYEDVFGDPDR